MEVRLLDRVIVTAGALLVLAVAIVAAMLAPILAVMFAPILAAPSGRHERRRVRGR